MPSRNILKIDVEQSYYHVYARGASQQAIFLEPSDFVYFQNLLARYLSKKPAESKQGITYPHFAGRVEVIAFCLMTNHFHLLIYQTEQGAMEKFMRSLMTSYSRYFNLKYKRTGSLFESRYKASRVTTQDYLEHISRYIHLNPRYWKTYPYSSLRYYRKGDPPEWLMPGRIMELFSSPQAYFAFVADYEDHKRMLDTIKSELADT
ncbi:MAG: transposase [Acidobacteriota bacterium]